MWKLLWLLFGQVQTKMGNFLFRHLVTLQLEPFSLMAIVRKSQIGQTIETNYGYKYYRALVVVVGQRTASDSRDTVPSKINIIDQRVLKSYSYSKSTQLKTGQICAEQDSSGPRFLFLSFSQGQNQRHTATPT